MEQATTTAVQANTLPALGTAFHGGEYAGVTTDTDGSVYALISLDDKPGRRLNFKDAMAWAESLGNGASLPNRVESLMLFMNLKGKFDEGWHWTREAYSERSAWSLHFYNGYQGSIYRYGELCARAVRRLPINPSIL
jgi:outer membrane receptor for ferric coprogen and ferric-rhodotorulic acid